MHVVGSMVLQALDRTIPVPMLLEIDAFRERRRNSCHLSCTLPKTLTINTKGTENLMVEP